MKNIFRLEVIFPAILINIIKILEENAVKLETLESEGRRNHSREEILKKYNNVQKLDRDIMDTLVEYIEIGRCEKKVHRNDLPPIIIHWKF